MEKRKFRTLIKGDHKVYSNEYVVGRINGFMIAMCMDDPMGRSYGINRNRKTGDRIMTVETTEARYVRFMEVVNSRYPDLCEFDV